MDSLKSPAICSLHHQLKTISSFRPQRLYSHIGLQHSSLLFYQAVSISRDVDRL